LKKHGKDLFPENKKSSQHKLDALEVLLLQTTGKDFGNVLKLLD